LGGVPVSAICRLLTVIGAALSTPKPLPPARECFDPHQVTAGVLRYAHLLGLDESNSTAAVARALRAPGNTLECIRAGHRAADGFLVRQRAAEDRRA
jgi:hypothetical protein